MVERALGRLRQIGGKEREVDAALAGIEEQAQEEFVAEGNRT